MSTFEDNPCLTCSTNQHCCSRLSGLMLAQEEFDALFKRHEHNLSIRRSNRVIYVTPLDGKGCPHWEKDGCRVYRDRPVDCRLFPYIALHVIERRTRVKIAYHGRSDCPKKEELFPLMPESEVRALVMALGKKLYGNSKEITVQHEKGILARLCNRVEAAISRRRFKAPPAHSQP